MMSPKYFKISRYCTPHLRARGKYLGEVGEFQRGSIGKIHRSRTLCDRIQLMRRFSYDETVARSYTFKRFGAIPLEYFFIDALQLKRSVHGNVLMHMLLRISCSVLPNRSLLVSSKAAINSV